jgi:hypothetical protein
MLLLRWETGTATARLKHTAEFAKNVQPREQEETVLSLNPTPTLGSDDSDSEGEQTLRASNPESEPHRSR